MTDYIKTHSVASLTAVEVETAYSIIAQAAGLSIQGVLAELRGKVRAAAVKGGDFVLMPAATLDEMEEALDLAVIEASAIRTMPGQLAYRHADDGANIQGPFADSRELRDHMRAAGLSDEDIEVIMIPSEAVRP